MRRPVLRLGADATVAELKQYIPSFGPPPHILLTDDSSIIGVIPQATVRAIVAETGVEPERLIRSWAEQEFDVFNDQVTVMDVMGKRSSTYRNIFVFTETGEPDPAKVTGVLTWTDVVEEASLPPSLRARMGRRPKPATAATVEVPSDDAAMKLEQGKP